MKKDVPASQAAADGVRRVIEAAEAVAAEIEAEARQEAGQIEAEARARVGAEAKQAQAAEDRVERANRELERIQSVLAGLRADAPSSAEPAPATAHEEPPQEPPGHEGTEETPAEAAYNGSPESEAADGGLAAGEDGGTESKSGSGGEGARLIALNMALTGTPREETARYLEENFEVDDPEALLDDVYSRAG